MRYILAYFVFIFASNKLSGQAQFSPYINPFDRFYINLKTTTGNFIVAPLNFEFDIYSSSGKLNAKSYAKLNIGQLRTKLLSSENVNGHASFDLTGPSIYCPLTKKIRIGAGYRTRALANFWNLNGRLISEIGEEIKTEQIYPYYFPQSNSLKSLATVFSEASLFASINLISSEEKYLSAGVSMKILNALAVSSIEVLNLTGTIKLSSKDVSYLTDASGTIETATSGSILSNFSIENYLDLRRVSVGSDIFLNYVSNTGRDKPNFALGLCITDIGRLVFHTDSSYSKNYNIEISSGEGLFFNQNFRNSSLTKTTEVFDSQPGLFSRQNNKKKTKHLQLPTSLRLNLAYAPSANFILYSDLKIPVSMRESTNHLFDPMNISISPCWTNGNLSYSFPLSWNEFAGTSLGLRFKYGGFFVGGNSIISGLIASRRLSAYLGYFMVPSKRKIKSHTISPKNTF